MGAFDFFFMILLFGGLGLLVYFSYMPAIQGKKMKGNDFALQVFTPTIGGTLLVGLAFMGLNWNSGDELKMFFMILTTVMGAIGISLMAISMSMNRIRWASPN